MPWQSITYSHCSVPPGEQKEAKFFLSHQNCICLISYLRKQSVRVVVPDTWLSPFTTLPSLPGLSGQNGVEDPGKSKLMSQNGSIVVETPLWKKKGVKYMFKGSKINSLSHFRVHTRYLLLRTTGSTSPLEGTQRWQKIHLLWSVFPQPIVFLII